MPFSFVVSFANERINNTRKLTRKKGVNSLVHLYCIDNKNCGDKKESPR